MREFETRQEAFFGRGLHVVQDFFPGEEALRIWAKVHAQGEAGGSNQSPKRGIKQGIWWEELEGSKDVLPEEEVREVLRNRVSYVSERPFFPGDACDGTRDACLWACLSDAISKSRADLQQFIDAIGEHVEEDYLTVRGVRRGAQLGFWEGTWCPKAWGRKALGGLIESMRSMNRHRIAVMIESEEAPQGEVWMEVLGEDPAPEEATPGGNVS